MSEPDPEPWPVNQHPSSSDRNALRRIVARVNATHTLSSTTGSQVPLAPEVGLGVGTYCFDFYLIVRSATTTVGPMLGVNFTGTAALPVFHMRWADATTAISAETHIMDNVGILAAGFISGMAHNAYSTTAPNMGTTIGVAAADLNIFCKIEGIIIVTVPGILQLWHSSETATATSVMVGSSLIVQQTG